VDPRTLRQAIKGEVLERSTAAYESALAGLLWNQLRADRRPDLIVRVRDEQDVAETVRFATANGLRVVARGGGHSWCGLAVREGGMLIDLEALNSVTLDVTSRCAKIQPFISNRDVIRHLVGVPALYARSLPGRDGHRRRS
jgi:FAD/FMN-containing dehydrogenase